MTIHDKPLAASSLTSYRYRKPFGFISIGARNDADALREAARSLTRETLSVTNLERWDGEKYVAVVADIEKVSA